MSDRARKLPPDPSRLIEGLRDTGYDFDTALSDIVDNSVDAEASQVDIRIRMDFDGDVSVTVADDGVGMDEADLLNAMTYGAKSKKDRSCLGKFGLGLKTASTAFCRRLSVITRAGEGAPVLKATWDLDHVETRGEWEVLLSEPSTEEVELLSDTADSGSGTLVAWEKVDRLLKDYATQNGKPAKKALRKKVDAYRDHASMVYQRFLDSEDDRARSIRMTLNEEPIKAWDPFCRATPGTELVAEKTVPVEYNGEEATFSVRAFVLPRREEFGSKEAAKAARLANKNQGIYVYREGRLIHPADWLGMFSKEPHFSLLRVEFSFDHKLDDAFHVDIKKSRILLRDELYNFVLNNFLPAPRRAAEDRYRKGQKKKAQEKAKSAHASSNATIARKESEVKRSEVTATDTESGTVELRNKSGVFTLKMDIESAARPGEVHVKAVPSIDQGLLWSPALIDGHHAVKINSGHAYYQKVYLPNLSSGVTIQGMDSLLWALAEAELGATTDVTMKQLKKLRYEVSRILDELVEDLPEPDLDSEDESVG